MIAQLLGGLGLFLYGMQLMSEGLEALTGDKLRDGLAKLTDNRFAAVAVGAGVTAVIQSSSATSVMVVGFVNAGLMTLAAAINVCMGANIGTTVTAQIVAINVTQYAPLILFAGVSMMFFFKKRSIKRAGQIIGGLGLVFFGMSTMSAAMAPLRDNPDFIHLLASFRNPWIGILAGVGVTAVLQSSSAMMGIVQAFAMQDVLGLDTAVYLILGLNIGACVTPMLAAIGGSKTAKRTAIGILFFNIIGAFVFLALAQWTPLVSWVEAWTPDEPVRQLANFHTLFNVLTTAFFLIFPKVLPRVAMLIIPGEDFKMGSQLEYLASPLPDSATVVVGLAEKETQRMMGLAIQNFEDAVSAFVNKDGALVDNVLQTEQTVNYLNHEITNELTKQAGRRLTPRDTQTVTELLHAVMNIERISDIAVNMSELAARRIERDTKIGKKAMADIDVMSKRVNETLDEVVLAFDDRNLDAAEVALSLEAEVDDLESKAKKAHIKRLKKGECSAQSSMLFNDFITMLERVADHGANIASMFLRGDA